MDNLFILTGPMTASICSFSFISQSNNQYSFSFYYINKKRRCRGHWLVGALDNHFFKMTNFYLFEPKMLICKLLVRCISCSIILLSYQGRCKQNEPNIFVHRGRDLIKVHSNAMCGCRILVLNFLSDQWSML